MKPENLPKLGAVALGVAATAALGIAAAAFFAANPQRVRRAAHLLAEGLALANLKAAQAHEQAGDLWAEAREAALEKVDGADFERQAAAAGAAAAGAAAVAPDNVAPATSATAVAATDPMTRSTSNTRSRQAVSKKPRAKASAGSSPPSRGRRPESAITPSPVGKQRPGRSPARPTKKAAPEEAGAA